MTSCISSIFEIFGINSCSISNSRSSQACVDAAGTTKPAIRSLSNYQPTSTSFIAPQVETNPYLRCHREAVRTAVVSADQVADAEGTELSAALRRWHSTLQVNPTLYSKGTYDCL